MCSGRHICALSGGLPGQTSGSDAAAEHLTSGGSPSQQLHLPNHVRGGKGTREEGSGGGQLQRGSHGAPAKAPWRMGGSSQAHRDSPGSPSRGGSQNRLHHRVRETAKTSDMNLCSRRAADHPGFSLKESKLWLCLYVQPCANTSLSSLAPCGFYFLLTRDTNWNHLFPAAPCADQTLFPAASWSPCPHHIPVAPNQGHPQHGGAPVHKEGEAGAGALSPEWTRWTGTGATGCASGVPMPQCARPLLDSEAANAELGSSSSYFYFLCNVV